jgi:curved DNA-binding protein
VIVDLEASLEGGTRTLSLRLPETGEDGRLQMRERKLNVKIPRGIQAGQHIRLTGQGGRLPGETNAGDLFLEMGFAPTPLSSEGRDLHLDLPVAP